MSESGAAAALARVDRPVFALDGDWRVTYANGAARTLLADGTGLEGRVFWDAVPGVTDTDVPETFHAAAEDGESRRSVVALADDRRVQFRVFPGEGGLTAVVEDVTDRYRQARRYEAVFEASVDPVCVVDGGGRFEDVNDAALEMTGYDREQLVGAPGEMVFEEFYRLRRRAGERPPGFEVGDEERLEVTIETATGTRRLCSVSVASLARGFVVVVRDVTDRRSREQRVAVLDRVLRHNIRNDLHVVEGYAGLIAERTDGEPEEMAGRIADSAEDLMALSETARELERAVRKPGRPECRNVAAELRAVVANCRDSHPEVTFEVDAPETCRAVVPGRVRRVLAELIENAAVHAGSPVSCSVEAGDERVTVRVSDTGEGLSETERRVLQAGRETQLEHGGGLGLWLVNWLVTSVGGEAETEVEDGTTVTVRLPATGETVDERPVERLRRSAISTHSD